MIVYAWARRTVGARAALVSGIILCLSARFLYLAGMVGMDSLLCACIVGALACGHVALAPVGALPRMSLGRWWWLASALCCGLGVMTKGPVALVLVLGPLLAWDWLDRRGARVKLGWWFAWVSIVLVVAAPWYGAITLRDPQATGTFFWLHNVLRYWAPFDHEKPGWFYLPGLVIGMVPWSLLLVPLVPYLWRRGRALVEAAPRRAGLFSLCVRVVLAVFLAVGMQARGLYSACLAVLGPGAWHFRDARFLSCALTRPISFIGAGALAVALLTASVLWLPQYHRKFGLGDDALRGARLPADTPVFCYPKRWDSVCFYLAREVPSFGPSDLRQMIALLRNAETLLFFKNDATFAQLLDALPAGMEFVPRTRLGCNVGIGLIRRKAARLR